MGQKPLGWVKREEEGAKEQIQENRRVGEAGIGYPIQKS